MKKGNLLVFLTMGILTGCFKDAAQDKEKIVEMKIYPETGYVGALLMGQSFTEVLIFSESDDESKQLLSNIITEGFDFDYEKGYEYTFKAKKVWMGNPPQDVSSIKYVFIGPLNKRKAITENSEETISLTVEARPVTFHPRFSEETVYDALLCRDKSSEKALVLTHIKGFDYEEGYRYELRVKKVITANPYSERYVLLDMVEKQKE